MRRNELPDTCLSTLPSTGQLIVLKHGECGKAPSPFVTWQRNCKNDGDGPPNYFWGHYFAERTSCMEDFCERAGGEYQQQKERLEQVSKKEQGEAR